MNDREDWPSLPKERREEVDVGIDVTVAKTTRPFDETAITRSEAVAEAFEPTRKDWPPPIAGASLWQRLLPLAVALLALSLDQFTKYLVETRLPPYQSWAPIPALDPFFRITHTTNTGAAFGLFQGGGWFFGILAAVVAVAIIYYSLTLPRGHYALRLALGLQLGGALGNLVDRVRLGHVTDFLDFGPWPVFNLADLSVVSGVVLLAWLMLREERQARLAQQDESEPDSPLPAEMWRDASHESRTRMNTD
jgi:signal peptidase II